MKKFFSALVISSLLFATQVTTGFARVDKGLHSIVPADTDIYVEMDLTEENPISDLIKQMVEESRNSELPFNEPGNIIAEVILNNGTTAVALSVIASEYGSDVEGYLIVEGVTKDEFDKFSTDLEAAEKAIDEYFNSFDEPDFLLPVEETAEENTANEVVIGAEDNPLAERELAPIPGQSNETETEENEEIVTTEDYRGNTIRTISGDTFGHVDGQYLVLSDDAETIKKLIDGINNSSSPKLNNKDGFQRISPDLLSEGFLHLFFSNKVYQELIGDFAFSAGLSDAEETILMEQAKLIEAVSFSVSQRNSTFHFASTMILNEEAQNSLNVHPDKYNFIPRLSKEFSSSDALFFVEQNNIQQQIADLWHLISQNQNDIQELSEFTTVDFTMETEDINKDLLENFGITLEELKDLTSKHFAFALYDNDEMLPGATLAFNVTDHEDVAERVSNFLNAQVLTNLEEFATPTSSRVNGKDLTSIELNTNIEGLNVFLTIGVVNNNMIISTDRQLKDHYGKDSISGSIDSNRSYNSISYIYPRGAGRYIENAMNAFGATDGATQGKIFTILLAPFGETFSATEAKADWMKTTGTFELNTNEFEEYERIPEIMFETAFEDFDNFETTEAAEPAELMPIIELCDVASLGDESQMAIENLVSQEVVKGDTDGCFHPSRSINRAEFVSLVDRAFDLNTEGPARNFSDVPASAWFANSVNRAATAGVIRGYEDNTFRPEQPITRAEAVKIINAAAQHAASAQKSTGFQDINDTDWFYVDVITAQENGIIGEAENFRPGDKLTREEAALMINRALRQ